MSEEKLKHCFSEALDIKMDRDFETLQYRGIEEWDSLRHMALVAAIETAFDIMLEPDDVMEMSSFIKTKEVLRKYGFLFDT
jgi:acyl carrier protein